MIFRFENIVSYLENNYPVLLEYLKDISINDMEKLFYMFPYKMAILLLHGDSSAPFNGKLHTSKSDDCFMCAVSLHGKYRFEVMTYKTIDYLCNRCCNKYNATRMKSKVDLLV